MHLLLVALIGLLLGGVVNTLADDLPAGRRPGLPKFPDGQRRTLLAWLSVTAFAFALRQARHRRSDETSAGLAEERVLSWRYPLVEITLSALMTLTYVVAVEIHLMSLEATLIWLAYDALFVLIAVIDIEHLRIHFASLLVLGALAFARAIFLPFMPPTIATMTVGALCAALAFSLVYLGGRLFARFAAWRWELPANVTVFGMGDVYLMAVGGLIVGFPDILAAMALTVLLGGAGGLCHVAYSHASGGYRRFSALPYGPFVLTSIYMVMLLPGEVSRFFFGL